MCAHGASYIAARTRIYIHMSAAENVENFKLCAQIQKRMSLSAFICQENSVRKMSLCIRLRPKALAGPRALLIHDILYAQLF